jgi:predicted transcriptional regulator
MEVIVMEEKNVLQSKPTDENYLFKTQGQMLLEMIAISGEYPAENIARLIDAPSYAKKIITKLLSKGLIKTVYKNSARGYRLTIKGKRQMMAENPDRFGGILEGVGDTNKFRSDLSRRVRLHSLAQVHTLMLNAGVEIFQDSKPMVFDAPSQTGSKNPEHYFPRISYPCFYSSREQKGDDEKSNAIQGSRAAGTILTPTHAYAVYNTGNSCVAWGEKVETRYKVEINTNLHRMSRQKQYDGDDVSGILIGESMESLERYWVEPKKKGSGLSFLANAYAPFYYITNDACGEFQLKLLYDNMKREHLRRELIRSLKLKPHYPTFPVEHDGLTEDKTPVLFCHLLNIPRLLRFFNGLARHAVTGHVVVFNHHGDVMKRYLGDRATYTGLQFEGIRNIFFPS